MQGGGDADDKNSNLKRKLSQKEYDKTKRKRLLKQSWLREFTWAEYDQTENALFCKVCRKFPVKSDQASSLVRGIRENNRRKR